MTMKPIRTDDDLRAAFLRLEGIYQADEGTAQADERDVLMTLIEAYENQHSAFGPADPVEAKLCDKGLARLKAGVTLAALQTQADAQTDLAAAQEMQRAKAELFRMFNAPRTRSTKAA